MALPGKWNKVFWGLAGLGALWASFLGSLTHPWLQRHALYAHKLHSAWWEDLDTPEKWGFMKNQIRPFNITTLDGEVLYAWHVLPLDVYRQYEKELIAEPKEVMNYKDSVAYRAVTKDPDSKVVVNFHGNAGHVGQGWRTDCYRAISVGSQKVHVIAFDYRGFGYSTGSPTEKGLIADGAAAVGWVLNELKVKPNQVALVGQSLGTAVATAVAEEFATLKRIEFAGLVLIAPFTNLPKLLSTYSIGRVIPIFSPLDPYPKVKQWFESKIIDTWDTANRLRNLVRASDRPRLYLIHAKDDFDIHWAHSTTLFYVAANATSSEGLSIQQMNSVRTATDLEPQGSLFGWKAAGKGKDLKRVSYSLMKHGGHNRITSYPILPRSILEIFDAQP